MKTLTIYGQTCEILDETETHYRVRRAGGGIVAIAKTNKNIILN